MAKNEVCEHFDKTNVRWNMMLDSSLIQFVVHTELYITKFHFAGADGMDNMRSNLYTILKEAKAELRKRGIKYE